MPVIIATAMVSNRALAVASFVLVSDEAPHDLRPTSPTWTHVALRVGDIDTSIAWYERFTPLRLLDKRQDDLGFGAWLGQPESVERPFILVLAQFLPATDPFKAYPARGPRPVRPPRHRVADSREALDEAARDAEEAGCLAMAPQQMPPPIGYVCMLRDPDGNMIEFSFDQGVYATARAVWGP